MSAFPGSPYVVRGGLVLLDPGSGAVQRVIVLQYNPDTLTRSLQVQGAGAEGGDRLDALRLKGAPIETIKLDAEIDATDQLEQPDQNRQTASLGIHRELAALETMIYPSSAAVQANLSAAATGTLEIAPVEAPLAVFVWSARRVLPVRVTEMSVTEDAFDPNLNPIRAHVSLTLRVLTTNDLPIGHRGASLFQAYHRQKEQLATGIVGQLSRLGIRSVE